MQIVSFCFVSLSLLTCLTVSIVVSSKNIVTFNTTSYYDTVLTVIQSQKSLESFNSLHEYCWTKYVRYVINSCPSIQVSSLVSSIPNPSQSVSFLIVFFVYDVSFSSPKPFYHHLVLPNI